MRYFDNHADTLTEIPEGESLYENRNDVDLKRVSSFSDAYTQVFALWRDMALVDPNHVDEEFERVYDRARTLLATQPHSIELVTDSKGMHSAHAAGHAAAFLSLEDASFAGSHAPEVCDMGIRFCMLAWNYRNQYACGSVCDQHSGLTRKGRSLVSCLVGQGMVMDVSHLSDAGIDDILSLVNRPIIASHSNARAVRDVPRNLPDVYIGEIARRGGIIGLNLFAPFVGDNPSVDDVLRHADHILEVGGEDVLAMGADFDGCDGLFPQGVEGVQSVPALRAAFVSSFGEALTEKIFYTNSEAFIDRNL